LKKLNETKGGRCSVKRRWTMKTEKWPKSYLKDAPKEPNVLLSRWSTKGDEGPDPYLGGVTKKTPRVPKNGRVEKRERVGQKKTLHGGAHKMVANIFKKWDVDNCKKQTPFGTRPKGKKAGEYCNPYATFWYPTKGEG